MTDPQALARTAARERESSRRQQDAAIGRLVSACRAASAALRVRRTPADAELGAFLLAAADDAAMQLAGEAPRRKPTNRELPDDTDEAQA